MSIKNRLKKLEGSKEEKCECSRIKITPDMDPHLALQLYRKMINCKAHHIVNSPNTNISPKDATRIYRKLMKSD